MTELQSVHLERHFQINRTKLFELLTTPHFMQQWFFPSPEIRMEVITCDLKPGGKYRFHYTMPDDDVHIVVGEYCLVDAPNSLAFTWGWLAPDIHAEIETLVTITLQENDSGTLLTVLHERLPQGEMRDRHEAGWQGTLENLLALCQKEGN